MIEAQPKAAVPLYHSFQKRWLVISVFALFGFAALCAVLVMVIAAFLFDMSVSDVEFGKTGVQTTAVQILLLAMLIFCAVFFGAGVLISRLAKDRKMVETAAASVIISIFIGVSGNMISSDFFIVALLLGLPGTVAVALGARIGGKPFERKQC